MSFSPASSPACSPYGSGSRPRSRAAGKISLSRPMQTTLPLSARPGRLMALIAKVNQYLQIDKGIPLYSILTVLKISPLYVPHQPDRSVEGAFLTTLHCLRNSNPVATVLLFPFPQPRVQETVSCCLRAVRCPEKNA